MPVDKETLNATIREVAGDDQEFYNYLQQKMSANEAAATQFLSGFMRNRDYTQKSQSLADERRTWDGERQSLNGQVEQYRQLLEAAESEKTKVMQALAGEKISVAQAHAALKHIKETYNLSAEDLPGFSDILATKQTGKPVDTSAGLDIDSKLEALEKRLTQYVTQKLVPELGGMARLPNVWADIRDEHFDLTGKRLTAKESDELLAEADKRYRAGKAISLKQLWEEKYDASGLRQKRHDEELIKKERERWDAEQTARRSEEALQGLHPTPGDQSGLRTSQILNHKFQVHEEGPGAAAKTRPTPSANERQALTGAERASKRYLERRAQGVPMGAPDERKPTKAA